MSIFINPEIIAQPVQEGAAILVLTLGASGQVEAVKYWIKHEMLMQIALNFY